MQKNSQNWPKGTKIGQNIAFSLQKKVQQLEKETTPLVVAVVTNMSYMEMTYRA